MQGTMRFASLDSTSGLNDASISRKRSIGALVRAGTENPVNLDISLDKSRAALSRHHVRTLNSQFASWVQAQLEDCPDELWEDGVRDYLSHARDIMEKFRDVVNWLKANSTKVATIDAQSIAETEQFLPTTTTKATFGWNPIPFSTNQSSPLLSNAQSSNTSPSPNLSSGLNSTSQNAANTSSGSSFGFFSNHNTVSSPSIPSSLSQSCETAFTNHSFQTSSMPLNTPVLFGQNSTGTVASTETDVNDENDLPQPSSPSLKKSEEKGIIKVHEVKCKVYVKASDPADNDTWKDRGTGQLVIKCREGTSKGEKESKPTIVVRNDAGKVLLNALLYNGIKTNVQKNSLVAIFHTAESEGVSNNVVARTYLLRTKSSEDIVKLQTIIGEYAPAS